MNPQYNRGQQDLENQGDGRARNTPGVYFHPEAGKFVETSALVPGHVQADAAVQIGYRKATDKEAEEYQKMVADSKKATKIAETRTVHR